MKHIAVIDAGLAEAFGVASPPHFARSHQWRKARVGQDSGAAYLWSGEASLVLGGVALTGAMSLAQGGSHVG